METIYPFKWLDNLAMNKLSLEGISHNPLNGEDILLIKKALNADRKVLAFEFLQKLLSLKNERHCKRLVNRYHLQLLLLEDRIRENMQQVRRIFPEIHQLNRSAYEYIEHVLSMLEIRFPNYLRPDAMVSDTFRSEKTLILRKLLKKLRGLSAFSKDHIVMDMLIPLAEALADSREGSYGQLNYWIEILTNLLSTNAMRPHLYFSAVEELLINMNFNHNRFASHLQEKIRDSPEDGSNPLQKEIWRQFRRITIRKNTRCLDTRQSLHKTMQDWFRDSHLNASSKTSYTPTIKKDNRDRRRSLHGKAIFRLSVDQLGILLRAADQTKLVDAPSFNYVCETMAPVLSTPERSEISPQSLRSNAYPSEETDKLATIRSLEKMIQWIREC